MPKNETGTQERAKTVVLSQIKKLDEIIPMIRNTQQSLNKSVTAQSAMLREETRLETELPEEVIKLMFTTLDRYLKAGQMLKETEELLAAQATALKNNL